MSTSSAMWNHPNGEWGRERSISCSVEFPLEPKWKRKIPKGAYSGLCLGGEGVICVHWGGRGLAGLDSQTGKVLWKVPKCRKENVVHLDGDTVYTRPKGFSQVTSVDLHSGSADTNDCETYWTFSIFTGKRRDIAEDMILLGPYELSLTPPFTCKKDGSEIWRRAKFGFTVMRSDEHTVLGLSPTEGTPTPWKLQSVALATGEVAWEEDRPEIIAIGDNALATFHNGILEVKELGKFGVLWRDSSSVIGNTLTCVGDHLIYCTRVGDDPSVVCRSLFNGETVQQIAIEDDWHAPTTPYVSVIDGCLLCSGSNYLHCFGA